jgi:hypothetical protein
MWRKPAARAIGVLFLLIFVISSASSVTVTSLRFISNSYAPDPTVPWVGVGVNLYPNGAVQYVSCSDYVYVAHGWETDNWSSLPAAVQSAFLDPAQANFTLETNASGFANPPLTQFTNYISTDDTMCSWFWFQFFPGDLAPGDYSFTGTWEMAAAANYPNYTAVYQQNTITLVVNLSNSTTSVSLSPNLVSAGSPVTCDATVSGVNVTGTVTWSTSSSTGSFSQSVCTLSSGNCSTTYTDINTAYATITASYSGDPNNLPSSGSTTLTVFVNVTTGTNVTVAPINNLGLTFANITVAGTVVANETPTVPAPTLDLVGEYYVIKVTASFSGNVTVSLRFDGSNMTQQEKGNLTMMQYTPIPGNVVAPFGTVDMGDVVTILRAFGSTPGTPNWNPACDLENNGKIDMGDVVIALENFGKTATWINITLYVDTTNNVIYGNTTHFSFIAVH